MDKLEKLLKEEFTVEKVSKELETKVKEKFDNKKRVMFLSLYDESDGGASSGVITDFSTGEKCVIKIPGSNAQGSFSISME